VENGKRHAENKRSRYWMAGYLLLILGKRHAKMQKTRKSMPGIEEAGMLKCEKREKACQGQKKQAC